MNWMNKILYEFDLNTHNSNFEEFNKLIEPSLIAGYLKRKNPELQAYFYSPDSKFDILFNEFDCKITEGYLYSDFILLQQAKKDVMNELFGNDSKHPYYTMFSMAAKSLKEGTFKLFLPDEAEYKRVKESLQDIRRPIITINGRNLPKIQMRNHTLYKHIHWFIDHGCFVINLTDVSPGFPFDRRQYREIPSLELSYNTMVSYFLNSNCLVSIGNAGGISTHMLTPTNLCILNSRETWIDNPEFSLDGITMLQARKNIILTKTLNSEMNYLLPNEKNIDNDLLKAAMNMPLPIVNDFFKIKEIESLYA